MKTKIENLINLLFNCSSHFRFAQIYFRRNERGGGIRCALKLVGVFVMIGDFSESLPGLWMTGEGGGAAG